MLMETLLPLGKVDPGLRNPETPLDVSKISKDAKLVESLGYDELMVEETKDDPFVIMALAAEATTSLGLGTAVAISFPRSPTVMAMRDYVGALKAIWDCWQFDTKLEYSSERYRLNLMVPLFNPGPIDHPKIPIHLAAVNPLMCQIAGELADGIRPHPVCTPSYIKDIMLPAVRAGASKSGRSLSNFKVSIKPLIATAPNEEELQSKIRDARARIAFYASTPAYRSAFDHLGLDNLADKAKLLARTQSWEELPSLISDSVLDQFVIVGTYNKIAKILHSRFGSLVTNAEFSIPVRNDKERRVLTQLISGLQNKNTQQAQAQISGGN